MGRTQPSKAPCRATLRFQRQGWDIMKTIELSVLKSLSFASAKANLASLRTEVAGGGHGILPGQAVLLTVFEPLVLLWRRAEGSWHNCPQREGALCVIDGNLIANACPQTIPDDDQPIVETRVRGMRQHGLGAGLRGGSQRR